VGLRFELKDELPAQLAVGRGSARLLTGWCFDSDRRIESLALSVDGAERQVLAHSLPRGDVLARMYPQNDPAGNSYWSGFYGLVDLQASNGSARKAEIGLVARLRGGGRSAATIAEVELLPGPIAEPSAAAPGREAEEATVDADTIAIAMATFDPDPTLFERQIASIKAQTDEDWICVISDDLTRPDLFEKIEAVLADDPRFVLDRGNQRLGFYRNFERALLMVPPEAGLVALSDQDDFWHPEKLATLRGEISDGVSLAYSDMRVVRPDGEVVSGTYWTSRPNSAARVDELLIANTVTGAASIFRRDLLETALPFPQAFSESFHDQWIAAVAACSGEIRYLDRPLQDYVQHEGNVLGHAESGLEFGTAGRLRRWRRHRPAGVSGRQRAGLALRRWQRIYVDGVGRMAVNAETLLLRLGDRLSPARRRELRRLAGMDSARGLAWLAGRRLRRPARSSPTIGNETVLAKGLAWRRLVSARGRLRRKPATRGGLAGASADGAIHRDGEIEMIASKLRPLSLRVDTSAEPTINVLIPFVDLEHLFGGYIAMFNLARRLAERGNRVRVVSLEAPQHPLPSDWRERLGRYEGLSQLAGRVEFTSAHDREPPLPVSPKDSFVAMSCWAAHVAHAATQEIGAERFVFAVQEYEPFFHPMGSLAALTRSAYDLPHVALFSSETLRDYFRAHRIGVYDGGEEAGESLSLSFENALTSIEPPSAEEMAATPPRLLFYARPERHAARNMYELGHLALARLIADGGLPEEWELYGIGSLESGSIELGHGRGLRLIARQSQEEYAKVLRSCSVGLSLMLTPHPSLPPLEMASAGMLTVTNSFETKTAEKLNALSANLIAGAPTIDGVSQGLRRAVAGVGDYEARIRGADVAWARNWEDALPDPLLERLETLIRSQG
jgi:hypothetical protein